MRLVLVRSPLRISLGGGGTDLPGFYRRQPGYLVSCAIKRHAYVAVQSEPALDGVHTRLAGHDQETLPSLTASANVLLSAAAKRVGLDGAGDKGIVVSSFADLPFGTGLGSSSSYTCALLTALRAYSGAEPLSPMARAEEAFELEAVDAGRPIGRHDQYVSSFGGVVELTIDRTGTLEVRPLDADEPNMAELPRHLRLYFTGLRRDSAVSLARRAEQLDDPAHQAFARLQRIREIGAYIADCLRTASWRELGQLVLEHWKLKFQTLAGDPVAVRINALIEAAVGAGAVGGKLIGPGGGGFLLVCLASPDAGDVDRVLAAQGLTPVPYEIDLAGTAVLADN